MKKMISVPQSSDDAFVYVPPRLDLPYLAAVLSRGLGREITICDCNTSNLCASNWGGVSNTGATVLRLSLTLDDGRDLDLVAKTLSHRSQEIFSSDVVLDHLLLKIEDKAIIGHVASAQHEAQVSIRCPFKPSSVTYQIERPDWPVSEKDPTYEPRPIRYKYHDGYVFFTVPEGSGRLVIDS